MARLHEFQGKKFLADHKITIPRGEVCATPDEARRIATELFGEAVGYFTVEKLLAGVA